MSSHRNVTSLLLRSGARFVDNRPVIEKQTVNFLHKDPGPRSSDLKWDHRGANMVTIMKMNNILYFYTPGFLGAQHGYQTPTCAYTELYKRISTGTVRKVGKLWGGLVYNYIN